MKSAFWRSIAVVALVAVPMMANANDATIGSEVANNATYGGTLMNTTAIFNAFPHLVVDNGTGVELNTMGDGMGKVWWEAYDNWWINMDVGRADYGMSGSAFMWGAGWSLLDPFAGSPVFANFNMVNLGVARATSNGGGWSARVMLAPMGGGESTENPATGALTDEFNATAYGVNGSWGNGDGLYIGAEWAMAKLETIDAEATDPTQTVDEESSMAFGVNARYDTDTYIYQANFSYVSESITYEETPALDPAFPDNDLSGLGFLVNAGRYLKNEVDGQTTVELGLGYASFSDEFDVDKDDLSAFLFPSVRVSAWENITARFGLMGGVGFTHAMLSDTHKESDDDTAETEDKLAGSTFDWSAGLFFQPSENVRIDFRFEESNLNKVLSLGNDTPLVMYLGTTVGLN